MKRTFLVIVGFIVFGILLFRFSYNLDAHHPKPAEKRYPFFFPSNGEVYPNLQVVVGGMRNGEEIRIGEITVSLEEFQQRCAEKPAQTPLITYGREQSNGNGTNDRAWPFIIHYRLSRGDGFYYHASIEMPDINWGSENSLFWTEWVYEADGIWVAKPVWENFWPASGMFIGFLSMLCGFAYLIMVGSVYFRYRNGQPA